MPTPNNTAATFRVNRVRKSLVQAVIGYQTLFVQFAKPEDAKFFASKFRVRFEAGRAAWSDSQPERLGKEETAIYYEVPEKIAEDRESEVTLTIQDAESGITEQFPVREVDAAPDNVIPFRRAAGR